MGKQSVLKPSLTSAPEISQDNERLHEIRPHLVPVISLQWKQKKQKEVK